MAENSRKRNHSYDRTEQCDEKHKRSRSVERTVRSVSSRSLERYRRRVRRHIMEEYVRAQHFVESMRRNGIISQELLDSFPPPPPGCLPFLPNLPIDKHSLDPHPSDRLMLPQLPDVNQLMDPPPGDLLTRLPTGGHLMDLSPGALMSSSLSTVGRSTNSPPSDLISSHLPAGVHVMDSTCSSAAMLAHLPVNSMQAINCRCPSLLTHLPTVNQTLDPPALADEHPVCNKLVMPCATETLPTYEPMRNASNVCVEQTTTKSHVTQSDSIKGLSVRKGRFKHRHKQRNCRTDREIAEQHTRHTAGSVGKNELHNGR